MAQFVGHDGQSQVIVSSTENRVHHCSMAWNRNFMVLNEIDRKLSENHVCLRLSTGYRETAYLHAITSAALTHAVASACKEGILGTCSCEHRHSHHTAAEIALGWQGCSDNIEFGYQFARDFVDAAEVGRDLRFAINIHNNEAGRLVSD